MPKLITFLTLLLLLLTIPSFSFTRSQGMGNAAIAVVDDVWAGAINPAGLGKLNGSVLDTAYDNTVIYDDMRVIDKAIAFAFRSDIGTFAFSYVSTELIIFGIALSSYNGARVVFDGYTNMSYAVNLYFASYGIQVVPGLSMGASLKQYQNTFSLETSKTEDSGTGVDIGLQLSSEMLSKEFPRLLLGVKVSDLGGTNIRSANGSIFNVKEVIQYGIGFSPIEQIALAYDFNKISKPQLGAEWSPFELLSIRMGSKEDQLYAGLGLKIYSLNIDYSYQGESKTNSEVVHTCGVGVNIK